MTACAAIAMRTRCACAKMGTRASAAAAMLTPSKAIAKKKSAKAIAKKRAKAIVEKRANAIDELQKTVNQKLLSPYDNMLPCSLSNVVLDNSDAVKTNEIDPMFDIFDNYMVAAFAELGLDYYCV